MNYKSFILSIFIIIIPLVLIILWYRNYVYQYCKNDMKCLKTKLVVTLNKLNDINRYKYDENDNRYENSDNDQIEGFFGGFGNWFSGSAPSNLPVSPGSLPTESLNTLEKKINDKMLVSNKFPPVELNGNSDDFKDSNNNDLLGLTIKKNDNKQPDAIFNKQPDAIFNKQPDVTVPIKKQPDSIASSIKKQQPNAVPLPSSSPSPSFDMKSLLGTCQFYNDKCPDKYMELGNFSSNSILTCGNVQNTKPARAIAQIKNNCIYEIHITDQGHGFNPSSPPKVTIEGGKGHGATAEAIINDDGFLKLIKVINPGYNYTETPNVIIDVPYINSSCHLCCKGN